MQNDPKWTSRNFTEVCMLWDIWKQNYSVHENPLKQGSFILRHCRILTYKKLPIEWNNVPSAKGVRKGTSFDVNHKM